MNVFFNKILLVAASFFVFTYTNGQVSFYANVSRKEIGKGERFIYKLIVENSNKIQHITAPSFKDFIIVGRPYPGMGVSIHNGTAISYSSLEYSLQPKRTGKFTLGAAIAIIDGNTYKSNTTTVVVRNVPLLHLEPPAPFTVINPPRHRRSLADFDDCVLYRTDSIDEKVNKNMEFRVELDKPDCYVGEPVVASYKLYTRLKSESKLVKSPSFTGFSVIGMKQRAFGEDITGKLNGKDCKILPVCKAQLYSLQPGDINLEPAELETHVQFVKEDYAKKLDESGMIFDDFPTSFFPDNAVIIHSSLFKNKPVTIHVKPLPEKNKPAHFKGAVGNFDIEAVLQKPLFSTDEAGKLSVTIKGSGNMQLLTAPDINWPAHIEAFDPKVTDNLVFETVPVSGNKKFEFSFSANDSGHYVLPAIQFSFFDPVTATYKTVTTDPVYFQVTRGDGHPVDVSKFTEEKQQRSFLNRIIYHRWWIISFIAALMLTGLLIWVIRDKKMAVAKLPVPDNKTDVIDQMIEASTVNQKNVFAESEKCLAADDCVGFYSLLNTELKNYLSYKFHVDHHVINSGSIVSLMDKKGISNETVLQLQKLMHDIEWQLYTPFERNEKMKDLYQQAHEIVQLINGYDITTL